MDWFLYDNGLRHERVKYFYDINDIFVSEDFSCYCRHIFMYLRLAFYRCMMVLYIRCIWFFSILIKLSRDVEENAGPKSSYVKASQSVTGT